MHGRENGNIPRSFGHALSWGVLPVLFILGALRATGSQASDPAKVQGGSQALEPGARIEREIAGSDRHRYHLAVAAGQFVHIVVEQRGCDVVVTLYAPDGRELLEVDSPTGAQGSESVTFIADVSGTYRIEVRPFEKEASPGRYEIRIEEQRPATAEDRARVEAARAFAEGIRLMNEGSAESRQKALEHFQAALPLFRAAGNRQGEATALNNIGGVYNALGERAKALEHYQAALALVRALGNRPEEAIALSNIAVTERTEGRLDAAREKIARSLELLESLRSRIPTQELRASFMAERRGSYEFYIDLLLQLERQEPGKGYAQQAFHVSERARARSLLELLFEAREGIRQGIAPEFKERERALEARINRIQRELVRARAQSAPDEARIAALEEELKQADRERENLELEIRLRHPRYAELWYPQPLDVRAVQEMLDAQTAMLEYVVSPEVSVLFAVSREEFLVLPLPADADLSERVRKLREALVQPSRAALSTYLVQARALYRELIEPAARILSGKRALVIVPDGILYYLPFEVLLSADVSPSEADWRRLPYLVREYALSYAPSATVWARMFSSSEASSAERAPKMFLAYADPAYGEREPEETSLVRLALRSAFGEAQRWGLKPLPHSRGEVERIVRMFPEGAVELRLGAQAREEGVKAEGRLLPYRFLHFAVHGLLNENQPQFSGLLLSLPQERGSGEDGLLQVYEIFNLRMNAEMVVLSACETGLGKEVRGEGLVGLTRAFLYTGASSVVVSLWKVADRSTADLMVRFYRHLREGRSKAEALRQARLEMIQEGSFAHPYHWAPFVLIGRP